MNFSKQQFLSLSETKKNKVLATLLATFYRTDCVKSKELYLLYQSWLGNENEELKDISSLYHMHLARAKISLKEHNLLPNKKIRDRKTPIGAPLEAALYLDELRSAHNVGSIIRTAEAFRFKTLYFSPNTPSIDHYKIKKTAMGTESWVTAERIETPHMLPKPLIALEVDEKATPIHDFPFPETFTLILGNEERGCSQLALHLAEHIVAIPLRGKKNSLNVACAFAIAAAEISKQRKLR